jgi:hypothetical protein
VQYATPPQSKTRNQRNAGDRTAFDEHSSEQRSGLISHDRMIVGNNCRHARPMAAQVLNAGSSGPQGFQRDRRSGGKIARLFASKEEFERLARGFVSTDKEKHRILAN